MTEDSELMQAAFGIIASVGAARSSYIEAIHAAKDGRYDEAKQHIDEANALYAEGHDAHMGLLQKEAQGEPTAMNLILTHAEDQLMSAEAFGILADEFMDVYQKMEQMSQQR